MARKGNLAALSYLTIYLAVSPLLEIAALRRLIPSAVLREFFLTNYVLVPIVPAHCEETSFRSWSRDSMVDDVSRLERAHLIRLAIPTTMLCHKDADEVFGFFLITLTGNSQKIRVPPHKVTPY